jgi:hypothetical protein
MNLITKTRTALALGTVNLFRVLTYKLSLKLGVSSATKISASILDGKFFRQCETKLPRNLVANPLWLGKQTYFGWYEVETGKIPNWHMNCFNSVEISQPNRPWWLISDFDHEIGDIKKVWEASRFDWVLGFIQDGAMGNRASIDKLNIWLEDWAEKNSPFQGPNWKCGQEASIRVMHLACAAIISKQYENTEPALISIVKAHLKRIAPTIQYAIAQDNNHGTSEAAALFIGGSWLLENEDPQGRSWQKLGLKWLENRAKNLIQPDGSFSQHSVNYHRVMLDTYCLAEVWRKTLELPSFSDDLYARLKAATNWLYQITNENTGHVPNLGANDGARLIPLTKTSYGDFRPSVHLSMVLFWQQRAWAEDGEWNQALTWLSVEIPLKTAGKQTSQQFDDGGYNVLHDNQAMVLFNYPRFSFRPSQADALHVDLWHKGKNLLRDGGTYSYNTTNDNLNYFNGTASHNTVQFDERDQMPRLSRFLLGNWLKSTDVTPINKDGDTQSCAAGYKDHQGAKHHRLVALNNKVLRVEDTISGFKTKAILRWRLTPGNWHLDDNSVVNGDQRITISTEIKDAKFSLKTGEESCHYLQKTTLPVFEIEIASQGKLITEYSFNKV